MLHSRIIMYNASKAQAIHIVAIFNQKCYNRSWASVAMPCNACTNNTDAFRCAVSLIPHLPEIWYSYVKVLLTHTILSNIDQKCESDVSVSDIFVMSWKKNILVTHTSKNGSRRIYRNVLEYLIHCFHLVYKLLLSIPLPRWHRLSYKRTFRLYTVQLNHIFILID